MGGGGEGRPKVLSLKGKGCKSRPMNESTPSLVPVMGSADF